MANKIYTKTGDHGKTSLLGGKKVYKDHVRIDAYGTVDELNSHIGLINDLFENKKTNIALRIIQDRLFTIGSLLSVDESKDLAMKLPKLSESDISFLENEIDEMNEVLPEMKFFILPGGHITVSQVHIARCICRRAERLTVHLQREIGFVDSLILIFLNRLSDYLFMLARFVAFTIGVSEIAWRPDLEK